MVTTRQRKAAATLEDPVASGETTAGPSNGNWTDPKVSVSGTHFDHQGLHVSLTIPFDSSVIPLTERSPGIPQAFKKPVQPQQGKRTLSRIRGVLPSPERSLNLSTADAATQTTRHRSPRPRNAQSSPNSPTKSRRPRGGTSPITTLVRATVADSAGVTGHSTQNSHFISEKRILPAVSEPFTGHVTFAPPERRRSRNTRARTRHTYEGLQQAILPRAALDEIHSSPPVDESLLAPQQASQRDVTGTVEVTGFKEPQEPNFMAAALCQIPCARRRFPQHGKGKRRWNDGAGEHKGFLDIFRNWWQQIHTALSGGERPAGIVGVDFANGLPEQYFRMLPKRAWWFVFAILLTVWVWRCAWSYEVSLALSWMLHENEGLQTAPEFERNTTRGHFYTIDVPEVQQKCFSGDGLCREAAGELCGFPVEASVNECVSLGKDVASQKAGGSIDYSATSGTAPQKALGLSRVLHNIASFAMPDLQASRSPEFHTTYDTSELENATLCQSYFPLFNHDNDPGRLLSDTPATYIITDTQGQVAVSLARRASVLAVAMETPAARSTDGQCGPLETHLFSVYVHLDEKDGAACPVSTADPGVLTVGHAESLRQWCKVGSFEYRCIDSKALQVFCLSAPHGITGSGSSLVGYGRSACEANDGWPTDRVRFVLKSNWGGEATRFRKIRVLAALTMP